MDPLALGPVHEYVKQQQHEDDSDSDNSEDSAGSFRFHLHFSLRINNNIYIIQKCNSFP